MIFYFFYTIGMWQRKETLKRYDDLGQKTEREQLVEKMWLAPSIIKALCARDDFVDSTIVVDWEIYSFVPGDNTKEVEQRAESLNDLIEKLNQLPENTKENDTGTIIKHKENTILMIRSSINNAQKHLEALGDEFDDFYSMERSDFLAKTTNKKLLQAHVERSNVDLLKAIAQKRLKEIESKEIE